MEATYAFTKVINILYLQNECNIDKRTSMPMTFVVYVMLAH